MRILSTLILSFTLCFGCALNADTITRPSTCLTSSTDTTPTGTGTGAGSTTNGNAPGLPNTGQASHATINVVVSLIAITSVIAVATSVLVLQKKYGYYVGFCLRLI